MEDRINDLKTGFYEGIMFCVVRLVEGFRADTAAELLYESGLGLPKVTEIDVDLEGYIRLRREYKDLIGISKFLSEVGNA